jgi:putative transcriptional regulator
MNLRNQLLISLPDLQDPMFHQSVILICEHDTNGAMGLILNKSANLNTQQIFTDLDLEYPKQNQKVISGGPLNQDCGFVLHNNDKLFNSSLNLSKGLTLTTSKDILENISKQQFNCDWKFILGYSGWSANQLESEVQQNAWLICPLDLQLIFKCSNDKMWNQAMKLIGISDVSNISEVGHA